MVRTYVHVYVRTYVRIAIRTCVQQALRCNGDTSGRCQHRKHHGTLQLSICVPYVGRSPLASFPVAPECLLFEIMYMCTYTYVRTYYTCTGTRCTGPLTYQGTCTYTCTYVRTYVRTRIRTYVPGTYVYPPKTHVVLGAHVCPFPIRKLLYVPKWYQGTIGTRVQWYHGTRVQI
jgi:hypothetical protein